MLEPDMCLHQILTSVICCSYGTVSNSKTIKNSRLVSQKDDVHVCIMCLRAIMNYQVPNSDTPVEAHTHNLTQILFEYVRITCFLCTALNICWGSTVWPHPVLSLSFSCSTASIWSCLTHTQSMKLLSAWTIKTHGKNRGPPVSIDAGLGQTIGETLQPVHMICLSFSMGLSFSLKSGIRGVHTGS